jgi:hypothetical protein
VAPLAECEYIQWFFLALLNQIVIVGVVDLKRPRMDVTQPALVPITLKYGFPPFFPFAALEISV